MWRQELKHMAAKSLSPPPLNKHTCTRTHFCFKQPPGSFVQGALVCGASVVGCVGPICLLVEPAGGCIASAKPLYSPVLSSV